jgi:lysophospholipase L1-like esterase
MSERDGVRGRLGSNLLLVLASAVIAVLLLEAGARIWLSQLASDEQLSTYGTFEQIRDSKELYFSRHRYLQYVLRPGYEVGENRHNSLGFRGDEIAVPKPPGVFRIVAVGASTTYTAWVRDYKRSYPHVLQEILRERGYPSVEVVNAGAMGYTTWESLINLELRVLDLDPDLVIVYHGINDAHARFVYPFEAYRGDNSGSTSPYERAEESPWDRSALLRILRTRAGWRRSLGRLGYARTYQYVPTNHASEFANQKLRGTYPTGTFAWIPAAEMLRRNPPVFFERNLRNMIAISREHGVGIVLMTFARSGEFPELPRASAPEYVRALTEQNAVIMRLCESHQVPCYDFAAAMPHQRELWVDGRHLNERGVRVKADLVADYLIEARLLPPLGP